MDTKTAFELEKEYLHLRMQEKRFEDRRVIEHAYGEAWGILDAQYRSVPTEARLCEVAASLGLDFIRAMDGRLYNESHNGQEWTLTETLYTEDAGFYTFISYTDVCLFLGCLQNEQAHANIENYVLSMLPSMDDVVSTANPVPWSTWLSRNTEIRMQDDVATYYGSSNCNYIVYRDHVLQNYGFNGEVLFRDLHSDRKALELWVHSFTLMMALKYSGVF